MTLPSTGPISFINLQDEFGGTNPIAINEYYRGGVNVSSALSQVPTAGQPIGLGHFRGASTSVFNGAKFVRHSLSNASSYSYINGSWVNCGSSVFYKTSDLTNIISDVYTTGPGHSLTRLVSTNAGVLGVCENPSTHNAIFVLNSDGYLKNWTSYPCPDTGQLWFGTSFASVTLATLYGSEFCVLAGSIQYKSPSTLGNRLASYTFDETAATAGISISNIQNYGYSETLAFCPGFCLSQGGDGLFLRTGRDPSRFRILCTSPDGKAWTTIPLYDSVTTSYISPSSGDYPVSCVAGNGKLIAVGTDGRPISVAADGTRATKYPAMPNAATSSFFGSLAYGNGYFVCVGTTSLASPSNVGIWTSTDGISWTYYQQINLTGAVTGRLEYHNGVFYLVGTSAIWTANA